jgi:hypothetical protein
MNLLELPASRAAAAAITNPQISTSTWSSSPAGLTSSPPGYVDGVDGTLHGWSDATIADRVANGASVPSSVSISGVSPATGPAATATVVTLTGTNFTGATAVWFAGVLGTGLTVVSATSITVSTPVTTPHQPVGSVGVAVVGPNGSAYRASAYTYS